MNLKNWYKRRGLRFVWQRGINIFESYNLGSRKAIDRIQDCLAALLELGCLPTFFVPAIIVQRNPAFIQTLQEAGAEIAVHGYLHNEMGDLTIAEANRQLMMALNTFERFGIESCGFRCPYISCSEELIDSITDGAFAYSSNQPVYLDVINKSNTGEKNLLFNIISKFYRAQDSSKRPLIPWMRSNMLEIPFYIPDDLQLHDGLRFDQAGILSIWDQMLQRTHLHGELFTLILHSELAAFCNAPLIELVKHARQYQPAVWITRLRDINVWWREKANFEVEITPSSKGMQLYFICSPHATILVRGLEIVGLEKSWDGIYSVLGSTTLEVPAIPRPFIGLASDIAESTISFLHGQGYILDTSEHAIHCGIYLDADVLAKLSTEVQLINYIEAFTGPLVRFWRWPDGAKSAFCITVDLDALSLRDYAFRLFGA